MKKLISAAALGSLFSMAAWCQATAGLGAISGTVLDASGTAVPGAKVTVANPSLGIVRYLTTTSAGDFAAAALTPEKGYTVTVEKQGFSLYEAEGLVLQVGQVLNLKIALTVGAVTQKLEVIDAAPLVN